MMHVKIDGDSGGSSTLKLRGVVLNYFDGKAWVNTRHPSPLKRGADGEFELAKAGRQGSHIHYRVTLEPYLSEVFFLLSGPEKLRGNYRTISEDVAGNVFDTDVDHPVTRHKAESVLRSPAGLRRGGTATSGSVSGDYLQGPAIDSRVMALAERVTEKAATPAEKAAAIENYLRAHYKYTLQLPRTQPADPIANFLFERREGHCEYFASAMAVMLRSLGIPSRVVNGFSGGEFNDITSEYVIRASDAHSWVEAYLPGEEWVEFDPTPSSGTAATSSWGRLNQYMDAMQSFWREWVVNYDFAHQFRLAQDAGRGSRELAGKAQSWGREKYETLLDWARRTEDRIGDSTVKWGLRALVVAVIVLFGINVPRMVRSIRRLRLARRPKSSPQLAASIWYERMLRQSARRGWDKAPGQTPAEFAAIIGDPQLRTRVVKFTERYESARFGKSADDAELLPMLYEEVKSSPKHHVET